MPSNTGRSYSISRHAVSRYIERVAIVDPATALRHIDVLACTGKRRSTPRHWTRSAGQSPPGTVYIYHPSVPRVCLLARGGTIVTVLERSTCRAWKSGPLIDHVDTGKRRRLR